MSRVPSASHAGPCTCVITSVEQQASSSSTLRLLCQKEVAQRTQPTCAKGVTTKGERRVAASKWRALIEQKAPRGKLWAAFGVELFLRGMWERFTIKKAWARWVLEDAEKCEAMRNGRHEAAHKDELELLQFQRSRYVSSQL